MMRMRSQRRRGSGLIIVLSVLALLAIMATSFITLMRLDTRVSQNYVDDQKCEMLAVGMLNYFKAILRDDLDRTWGKYENRDTSVGFYSWNGWQPPAPEFRVPGFAEWQAGQPTVDEKLGTPPSNDFWYSPPYDNYNGDPANLYVFADSCNQQGFSWQSHYGRFHGRIGRHYDPQSNRDWDIWVGCSNNWWDDQKQTVDEKHPRRVSMIDDDADGICNPGYYATSGTSDENYAIWERYFDMAPYIIYTGACYYQPGPRITGEATLPGGIHWRWGFNVGPTQEMYGNLNVHGNMDGSDSAYVRNIGNLGLVARRAFDERASVVPSDHLGRIEWQGFPGEYEYGIRRTDECNKEYYGFPLRYNNVMYPPAAANVEKLFRRHEYEGQPYSYYLPPDLALDRGKARALIRYRLGQDGLPGSSPHDRWRVGWRRDGGSYYRFPSPENPLGDDRFFGVNEVLEHDHSVDHPGTSVVANILDDTEWRTLRPHMAFLSTDTILRGKIWPTEGRLPWRPGGGTVGDWRHMDILKRVNLNIIGASGPEGLPGEDATLKTRWAAKRAREQDRLYFMLVAALRFTNTPAPEHEACQFIASLADMVDRDRSETYYAAPDGSGNWALGVEKQPVINEVVFYSKSAANSANYELYRFRVELYNPMENIPWIPDGDEAYDVSNYVLRIASHDYRPGDMVRYTTDADTVHPDGMVIGACGMYGDPADATADKQSWKRYAHVGWVVNWPPGLTRAELEGAAFSGVKVSLWKPLSSAAPDGNPAGNVPLAPGKVEMINGIKHVCVDATENLQLVRPYGGSTGRSGPGGTQQMYLGIYRRWDPMNAKVYGTQGTNERSNVLWCPGYNLGNYPTLGRPNTDYPGNASTTLPPGSGISAYKYQRKFERNFKVADGDLPSIGWLGELMMKNCAQDGPLTWVHTLPQKPDKQYGDPVEVDRYNELDTKAKFDLMRPFTFAGTYDPPRPGLDPVNLHVLDIFTVWDPSSDGIDNDGDGAVDDDDTGLQPGDRCGPEIRVFGKIDLNQVSQPVLKMVFPDGPGCRRYYGLVQYGLTYSGLSGPGRASMRGAGYGPFETVGDLLRADDFDPRPGAFLSGSSYYDSNSAKVLESGITTADDDGDGIINERDERDMVFNWISNYLTTRANVVEVDLNVELCDPPRYPGKKLPFRAYKSDRTYARKQLLGIFDRSTILRVNADGTCDFTGPVEVRMTRVTDDLLIW